MRTDDHSGTHTLTERIIGGALRVANILGTGFLETVYTNALAHELRRNGLAVTVGARLLVRYEGVIVGTFIADLIVEDQVIVELKVAAALHPRHVAQCLNYLQATRKTVCLLLNFGTSRLEVRRVVGPG